MSLGSHKFLHTSFTRAGKSSVVSGREAVLRHFVPEGLVDSTADWVAGRFRLGAFLHGGCLADRPGAFAVHFGITSMFEWVSKDSSRIPAPALLSARAYAHAIFLLMPYQSYVYTYTN